LGAREQLKIRNNALGYTIYQLEQFWNSDFTKANGKAIMQYFDDFILVTGRPEHW